VVEVTTTTFEAQRAELAARRFDSALRYRVVVGGTDAGGTDVVSTSLRALRTLGHTVLHAEPAPGDDALAEIGAMLDRFRPHVLVAATALTGAERSRLAGRGVPFLDLPVDAVDRDQVVQPVPAAPELRADVLDGGTGRAGVRRLQTLRESPVHVHRAWGREVLESVAAGAVVLVPAGTDAAGRAAEAFDVGSEVLTFAGEDDLRALTASLLADPRRREGLRSKAFARLVADHLAEQQWLRRLAVLEASAAEQQADWWRRATQEAIGRPVPVVLLGWYGAGNVGDDLILEAIALRIEADVPDAQVVVAAKDPRPVLRDHGLAAFDRLDRGRAEDELARSAALVVGGGGLWMDYTFALNGGLAGTFTAARASPSSLSVLPMLADVLRKPVHVYGMGVGPLDDPRARALVRHVADRAASVVVRDEDSRRQLQAIDGWTAPVGCEPDVVFSLPVDPARRSHRLPPAWQARPVVAVNARPWPAAPAALQPALVAALADAVRTRGAALAGVPMSAVDTQALRALFAQVDVQVDAQGEGSDWVVLEPTRDLDQSVADLSACRTMVSMRLHGCLLGHRAGLDVIGLGYDPKVANHFEEVGRPAQVLALDDAPARLQGLLASALDGDGRLPAASRRRVAALEQASARGLQELVARLRAAGVPAAEPSVVRYVPDAAEPVPGRVTVAPYDEAVVGGSTLDPTRAVAVRKGRDGAGVRFSLVDSAPLAGDFAAWECVLPGAGAGRRVEVTLRSPYREDPAMTGRLVWQLLLDGRVLAQEDVAAWSEENTVWAGWGPRAAPVRLQVRVLALRDCEAWSWGRAAALVVQAVRSQGWAAPVAPGRHVVGASSPATRLLA
jgi:polysaccharide pyruvyl transferase CsaB